MASGSYPLVVYFQSELGGGGATRSNLKIASALADKGFKVHLVTGSLLSQEEPHLPSSIVRRKLNFSKTVFSVLPLVKYIKEERPDVIISGLLQNNIALGIAKLISRSNTKVVFTDRVAPTVEIENKKGFLHRILPTLMRVFYPQANCLVSVSKGTADDVLSIVPSVKSKIKVIYNPAVTAEKIEKSYDAVLHDWIHADVPLIVGVGRLEPQKDYITLIDAFNKVHKIKPCRLLIIGEGSQRASLEEKINSLELNELISMPGFIANPHPYLRNSDLFVLSSAWEGLPNVLLEAMAYGTSVISTDCLSGPSEILESGRLAPLVPVGDVDAMAQAMISVLDNPQDPEKLIARANMFNEEQSIKSYVELINGLLN